MGRKPAFLLFLLGVLVFLSTACTSTPTETVVTPIPAPSGERVVTILGTVKDCLNEQPIAGAEVKIEYQAGGLLFTSTDGEGYFEIKVPLGQATVTIAKPGYRRQFFSVSMTTPGSVVRLRAALCRE